MATIGQKLTTPESGWKRIDESDSRILYSGTWTIGSTAGYYNGTRAITNVLNDKASFKFQGSKLRIIGACGTSNSNDVRITIDGVNHSFNTYAATATLGALMFEKLDLLSSVHEVTITNMQSGKYIVVDAIDVDSDGRLLHPIIPEVFDVKDLVPGKCIRCHYEASSNAVGTFSGLGKETAELIPPSSIATPSGDFYLIHTGFDEEGRMRLVADRNIQHSISWDTLNSAGIISGLSYKYDLSLPLVAAWQMDEASGSTVYDIANRYNGTCTGTTLIKDSDITFRKFDGTIDKIDFASSVVPVGKKTIKFKIKLPTDYVAVQQAKGNTLGTVMANSLVLKAGSYGISIYITQSGGISYLLRNNNTNLLNYDAIPSYSIFDDKVHDVCITFDGTVAKTYIDNMSMPLAQATTKGPDSMSYSRNLAIGYEPEVASRKFYGSLSEIEIYSDVVDPTQALQSEKYNTAIRLLTGGVSSTDKDNEWDKIIAESSLNGSITSGDNNIWNWNGINSHVSNRSVTSATSAVRRGGSGGTSPGEYYDTSSIATSTVHVNLGFRPVFIISKNNFAPILNLSVDRDTFYNEPISLYGSIMDPNDDAYQYRILLDDTTYQDWTSANDSVIIDKVFSIESDFSILVEAKNEELSSNFLKTIQRKLNLTTHISYSEPLKNFKEYRTIISSTETALMSFDIDNSRGYILKAYLNLNLNYNSPGAIQIGLISTQWSPYTVTYNDRPQFDSETMDYEVNFAGPHKINITPLIKKLFSTTYYGLYISSNNSKFTLGVSGNDIEIEYQPTMLNQPKVVYGDRCLISWKPIVFYKMSAIEKLELWRSKNEDFSDELKIFETDNFNLLQYFDKDLSYGTYYYRLKIRYVQNPYNGDQLDFDYDSTELFEMSEEVTLQNDMAELKLHSASYHEEINATAGTVITQPVIIAPNGIKSITITDNSTNASIVTIKREMSVVEDLGEFKIYSYPINPKATYTK